MFRVLVSALLLFVSAADSFAQDARILNGYTVTVTTSGEAQGRVTAIPSVADATPLKKLKVLKPGTKVRLRAVPLPGAVFVQWTGDCTGTKPTCKLTVQQNARIDAEFTWKNQENIKKTLTVVLAGTKGGIVRSEPPGIECGGEKTACSAKFYPYAKVTLTATPLDKNSFLYWEGPCPASKSTCQLTVTKNVTATAAFGAPDATLTVLPVGPGKGYVVSDPPGIACIVPGSTRTAGPCSITLPGGTLIRLKAQAQEGSTFGQWIENVLTTPSLADYAITLVEKTLVRARFDDLTGNAELAILTQKCTKSRTEVRSYTCTDPQSYAVCRKQFQLGAVHECIADFPAPSGVLVTAAAKHEYDMRVDSDLSVTVWKGKRGEGTFAGSAQILLQWSVPQPPQNTLCDPSATGLPTTGCSSTCTQRTDLLTFSSGENGGIARQNSPIACGAPTEWLVTVAGDEALRAYNYCLDLPLWGGIHKTILKAKLAGLFTFQRPVTTLTEGQWSVAEGQEHVQPTVTAQIPVDIHCR